MPPEIAQDERGTLTEADVACRERGNDVHWEAVAEFREQLIRRQTGEVDVFKGSDISVGSNGYKGEWMVIDGTGKTCASILAELSEQVETHRDSFVEVVMPDVLNTYDVIVWAEKNEHKILTQRRDQEGSIRILIQP